MALHGGGDRVGAHARGALPTAEIGSGAWWWQKLPTIGLSIVLLVPLVAVVSRLERRALFVDRSATGFPPVSVTAPALVIPMALEFWTVGHLAGAPVGADVIAIAPVVLRVERVPALRRCRV